MIIFNLKNAHNLSIIIIKKLDNSYTQYIFFHWCANGANDRTVAYNKQCMGM